MTWIDRVKVWGDVLDAGLDDRSAPSLGGVHLGREHEVYVDPGGFFRRTLLTSNSLNALSAVAAGLRGSGRGGRVLVVHSLFGGGKTHLLLTIYHGVRSPGAIRLAKLADGSLERTRERVAEALAGLGDVKVIVVDGTFGELAPRPNDPLRVPGGYSIRTLWGAVAHQLGRFGEVESYDAKLTPPPSDVIARVLGDRPVVILMDELAKYIRDLKSSNDEVLRNYVGGVISFVENLASAVVRFGRSVLVVSLPVEEDRVEDGYSSVASDVLGLYKSVKREGSPVVPASPEDAAKILRVRLFEEVKGAAAVAGAMAKLYSDVEVFGRDAAGMAGEINKTYPFHPLYVETLARVVSQSRELQKTRDLIRISRKVVRRLLSSGDAGELIMPYDIDVEDVELRGILLRGYEQFEEVLREDLKRAAEFEKPAVAKAVAKSVFVMTYIYAGTRQLQLYPDRSKILLASFEPGSAERWGARPKDYVDALEWLARNLAYMVEEGGRYWFTFVSSPVRLVEVEAKNVDDFSAKKVLLERAKEVVAKTPEEAMKGRGKGRGTEVKHPFNVDKSKVLDKAEPVDYDERSYVILGLLFRPRGEELEMLMYERAGGGQRRYANSIYLVYPASDENVQQMLGLAKLHIACGRVEERLGEEYRDPDVGEVMKRKLNRFCSGPEGVEGRLLVNIVQNMNMVAYPAYEGGRNTYTEVQASVGSKILETVISTLRNIKPEKLKLELTYDELELLLERLGVKISEGEEVRRYGDIVDYFYSNPALPAVPREALDAAVTEGVRLLRIGLRRGGRVWFKKVRRHQGERCEERGEEGEVPADRLQDSDEVLPWRTALLEQLRGLKGREERVNGKVRRVWYAFCIGGRPIPVEEALNQFDLEVLKGSSLLEVVEEVEEGFDLKLDRYELELRPKESASVDVVVERIGDFRGVVSLVVDGGQLEKSEVDLGGGYAEVAWIITAPEAPGVYTYKVEAVGGGLRRSKTLTVKVIGGEGGCIPGAPPTGTKVVSLVVDVGEANLRPLKILRDRLGGVLKVGEAELKLKVAVGDVGESEVELKLKNVGIDDLMSLFAAVVSRYAVSGAGLTYRAVLKSRGVVEFPQLQQSEVEELRKYMCYEVAR